MEDSSEREPSSEIDGHVLGSIGSGVAKGLWRHVTTAMWQGVGKDLGVPPREVALVVAAPGAVVLEVKENVGATKARDDDAGRRSAGGGAAMVGATEAAAGPDVDSRGGDSARSLGGAAAEGGACRARGQRRFSWARRSRVRATSSLAATREVRFTGSMG